jgi:hypothetical protein
MIVRINLMTRFFTDATFSIYKYNGIRRNCCNTRCQRNAIVDEAKVGSSLTRSPADRVTFSNRSSAKARVVLPTAGDDVDTDEEAPEKPNEEATDDSDFLVDFPNDTEVH